MGFIKQRWVMKGGLFLVGLLIMIWLLSHVSLFTVLQILHHANYVGLFIAMLVFVVVVLLRGWKWYFLTTRIGSKLAFVPFMARYLVYYFYSALTPLRSGDVFAPLAISRDQKHRLTLYRSLLVDRFIDTMILGLLTLLSIFYFYNHTAWILHMKLLWILKVGMWFIVMVAIIYFLIRMLFPSFLHHAQNKLQSFLKETGQSFKQVHPKWIVVQIGMSLIMWLIDLSYMYIVMKSIGLDHMLFIHSTVCQIGATVFSILTMVPAGIGTGDTSYMFLCAHFHYPQAVLIMGTILSKLLFLLLIAILHLIGYLLIHITRIKK